MMNGDEWWCMMKDDERCMMNEVADASLLINECILSDYEIKIYRMISYVHLCVPMASIEMTPMTQANYTDTFAQRNLCAEEFLYAEELLHTEVFTQRNFYAQKPSITQKSFYTEELLHRRVYTGVFTYWEIFTPVCDLRPSLRAKGRRCPATKNLHFTTRLVCASDTHDVRTEKNFKIAILSHDLRRGSRFDGHVKRIWKNLEVGVYWGFSNTSRSPRI